MKHGNAVLILLIVLLMEGEVLGKLAIIDIAFGKVVVKNQFHVANNGQLFDQLFEKLSINKQLVTQTKDYY